MLDGGYRVISFNNLSVTAFGWVARHGFDFNGAEVARVDADDGSCTLHCTPVALTVVMVEIL